MSSLPSGTHTLAADARKLIATLLLAACASSASSVPAGSGAPGVRDGTALRNVDVTVVYPLPTPEELDALPKPADIGKEGPLLSAAVFPGGEVPELDPTAPRAAERLDALRVVAVRLDPCPGAVVPTPADHACKPDVRLVFQSLRVDAGMVFARDGAIHAFYELPQSAFAEMTDELRRWRKEESAKPGGAAEVPLGAHPLLAAEGLRGPFATRFSALLLKYLGEQALVRVTHFTRRAPSQPPFWEFAIRERNAGAWSDSTIATTTATKQSLLTISGGRWDADMTPKTSHADDVTKVFKVATDAERRAAFAATVHVLNPRVHTSETIDCASCHVAPDIAIFAGSTLSMSMDTFRDRFQSTYSLDATKKDHGEAVAFENVHMISYLGRSLSLASRTVNETAAVLELLNAKAP